MQLVMITMFGFILKLLTLAGIAWYLANVWGYNSPEKYVVCAVVSSIVTSIVAMVVAYIVTALYFRTGFAAAQSP